MPKGVYARRPRLTLITDQRPKRKVRKYTYPHRWHIPQGGGVRRCLIVHEFEYLDVAMCVVRLAPQDIAEETHTVFAALAPVDLLAVVPKFRLSRTEKS